ncbi:hypothetical protein [Pontibacter arcticus]|uniref:Uncharacterized protein n=1 Tax=Pontibacter arcticus TaxID=2080288 RepID=A0A364RBZ7_9BACT|nr:hypothetical protein [Pontibacter arcticus]RAU81787.1 hypothetical protein DP923_13890 [Pontibacter arcticus]
MKELEKIQQGLANSNTLVLTYNTKGVECSFVKEGLVKDFLVIEDKIIAEELNGKSVNGIIEGSNFHTLKADYGWFSLRVKSKKLYQELL